MREIKFRGYDIKLNQWIYGYYVKHIDATLNPLGRTEEEIKKWNKEHTHHYIVQDGFSDWDMPRGLQFNEIDERSVGQSIGLFDVNKKEIFEGDIVKYTLYNKSVLYEVKYNNSTLSWQLSNKLENENISFAFKSRLEVIGNVYENPKIEVE